MYLRFILPGHRARCGTSVGFFQLSYRLRDSERVPSHLRRELAREMRWFASHLDVPDRFYLTFRKGRDRDGYCWFRPGARECIDHARYTAWLMSEAGQPVWEVRTADPGTVLWRDDQQVVALPR